MEEPQELTAAAVLSLLPSIGVTLDNSGMENRRGVACARLPEKSVQNCDATVIMGHRAGLDENEARWVGDRRQPSDEGNAVPSGWHDARAHSGRATPQRWAHQMVGVIMMAGNRWVSGDS